jgi:hypothetical protein
MNAGCSGKQSRCRNAALETPIGGTSGSADVKILVIVPNPEQSRSPATFWRHGRVLIFLICVRSSGRVSHREGFSPAGPSNDW